MTKIYFKNTDTANEKEIKIYSLDKDGVLPLASQFTSLDTFNKAIGIKLLANVGSISCVGATKLATFTDMGNPNVTADGDVIIIKFTVNGTQSIEYDYYTDWLTGGIQSEPAFGDYLTSIGLSVYDTSPGEISTTNLLNTGSADITFTLEIVQSKSTMASPTKISDIYRDLSGGAVGYVTDDKIAGCIGIVDPTFYISCAGATSRLYWTNDVRVSGQTEVSVAWTINGVVSNASYISDGPINALSLSTIFRQKMNLNIPGFSHNNDGWLVLEILDSGYSEYNPDLEDVRIDIKTLGTIATIPDVNDELSPAVWKSDDNREMKICITKPIPA